MHGNPGGGPALNMVRTYDNNNNMCHPQNRDVLWNNNNMQPPPPRNMAVGMSGLHVEPIDSRGYLL